MREAVVVASSRTPLAKSFRGSLNMTRPDDYLAHCIQDVIAKAPELDAAEVEDVIVGCARPEGSQGSNVARVASIRVSISTSWNLCWSVSSRHDRTFSSLWKRTTPEQNKRRRPR